MPNEIVNSAKNIVGIVNEVGTINSQVEILKHIRSHNIEQRRKLSYLIQKKRELLTNADDNGAKLYKLIIGQPNPKEPLKTIKELSPTLPKPQMVLPKEKEIPLSAISDVKYISEFSSQTFRNLTSDEKNRYIKELNVNQDELRKFIKQQRAKSAKEKNLTLKKEDYTIYTPSELGAFSNKIMKNYADNLVTNYPGFFEPMFKHFKMVEMELLSRSYISMMLLFTLISFPATFLVFLALNISFKLNILTILAISFIGMIATFFGFYFYPASLIGDKNDKIKLELPFALVHMSAVAGSGGQPINIFQLIVDSDEYPELKKEIKKILNYVNLFGYNLTNALKNVAVTTPNPEFKELLNGMISTVESGGDLKGYLKEKADEALNSYKLERRKQVEALSTYSEVYTAILIAAPLLLLVTLAIINSIGGSIGGLSIGLISWGGILGVLPLLNIGFMAFITASQKGV